jgi:hypothetical protein
MARFYIACKEGSAGLLFGLGAWLGLGTLRQPNVRHHMAIYFVLVLQKDV